MVIQKRKFSKGKSRQVIRELAKQVAEAASGSEQREKTELWTKKNGLERVRPLVLIFPEGSWEEIMADWHWETDGDFYRPLETDLRMRLYYRKHLQDDNVIEPVVFSPIEYRSTGYGLDVARIESSLHKGSYRIDPTIKIEADIEKIKPPHITVDWEATERSYDRLQDLFNGILKVEKKMLTRDFHRGPSMDMLARWRGIEQLFLDLVMRPDWIHRIMSRLLECKLAELNQLEKQNALTLNHRNYYNGSGGVGYTAELPRRDFDGVHVRPRDMWGYSAAQIFSEVSPKMHEEFALQYERPYLERFGLSHYGCCEPLHDKLEYVKKIRNLRVVSISPWADIEKSAAGLEDRYVLSWKPNPAVLAAPTWHPDTVRRIIRDFLAKTRGCITQIVMKDTHTCQREPYRLWEWVRIAREEAEAAA